jgi:hypothetical protein
MVQTQQPRARRYPFVATAEITDLETSAQLREEVSDLSLFGCYVNTTNIWAPGTKVRIRIAHNGGTFAALATVANVRRETGMGIVFKKIEPKEQALLDRWIAELRLH